MDREVLSGVPTILRYLARAAPAERVGGLYGRDALGAAQVDGWIDASCGLAPGAGLAAAAAAVSAYLGARSLLVGYELTLGDIAVWGQLQGTLQWDKLRKGSEALGNVGRWYDFVGDTPALKHVADTLGPRRRFTTPKPTSNPELAGAMGGGGAWVGDARGWVARVWARGRQRLHVG